MIGISLSLAALALLAGCSSESKDTAPAPDTPKQAEVAPAKPSAPPKASAAIAVDGEGLRMFFGAGEDTRAILFGHDEATAITAIEKLRGKAKRSTGEECGAGPVQFAQFGGLTLLSQDGKFGGWAINEDEKGGISTVNGIAIGSSRASVEKAFPGVKIDVESTLGIEFYTGGNEEGGISGLLDGSGVQAKVTHLWSGLNCVFR
jgi:hypothetical protein